MALGGHVLAVLVALGDKHPGGQRALARHPRRPEDVFSLELAARLLCFCQGDKRGDTSAVASLGIPPGRLIPTPNSEPQRCLVTTGLCFTNFFKHFFY